MTGITVVPDSTMFADAYGFNPSCLDNSKLKIGLNFASDRWLQRFDDKAAEMLNTVLNVCSEKAIEHNAYVYIFEHLILKNKK